MNKKVLIGIIAAVVLLAVAAAFALPAILGGNSGTPQEQLFQAFMKTAQADDMQAEGKLKLSWNPINEEMNIQKIKPFVEKSELTFKISAFDLRTKEGQKQIDYRLAFRYGGGEVLDLLFRADTKRVSASSSTPYKIGFVRSFEEMLGFKMDFGKYVDLILEEDEHVKKVMNSKELRQYAMEAYEGAVATPNDEMPDGEKGTLIEIELNQEQMLKAQKVLVDYYFEKEDLYKLIETKVKNVVQLLLDSEDYRFFSDSDEPIRDLLAQIESGEFKEKVDDSFRQLRDDIEDGNAFNIDDQIESAGLPAEFADLMKQKITLKYWIKDGRVAFMKTTFKTPLGPLSMQVKYDYEPKQVKIKDSDATVDLDNLDIMGIVQGFVAGLNENQYATELFQDLSDATGSEITPDSLLMLLMMGMRSF
ncbi:MAG: hypothetical protein Q4A52_02155 [Bacillota bacterium]|nr:hypothetical protein [Bacillota bacterium]